MTAEAPVPLRSYLLDELADCRATGTRQVPTLPPDAQRRWRALERDVVQLEQEIRVTAGDLVAPATVELARQLVAEAVLLFAESRRQKRPSSPPVPASVRKPAEPAAR
jgi:hypothetical protein